MPKRKRMMSCDMYVTCDSLKLSTLKARGVLPRQNAPLSDFGVTTLNMQYIRITLITHKHTHKHNLGK